MLSESASSAPSPNPALSSLALGPVWVQVLTKEMGTSVLMFARAFSLW